MKCHDCREEMTETELKAKTVCVRCSAIMHSECSMADSRENDVCEACYFQKAQESLDWAIGIRGRAS